MGILRNAAGVKSPARYLRKIFELATNPQAVIETYVLKGDGTFPNSPLPVLHYRRVLELPAILPATFVRRMFARNGWTNAWTAGIYTFDHYHSNTHEVLAIIKGSTKLRLGGKKGIGLTVREGDVLILPAGTAHRNLQDENAVVCVGAYPSGADFDIMRGKESEQPAARENIRSASFPAKDPVFGIHHGTGHLWTAKKKANSVSRRPNNRTRTKASTR